MGRDELAGATKQDLDDVARHHRDTLLGAQPDEVQLATGGTNGGTTAFDQFGAMVQSDAAADDFASIFGFAFDNVSPLAGLIIIGVRAYHDSAIGAAADFPVIGYVDADSPDPTANNIAVFNPGAGQDTAGNVRVDDGGADTDGSITYPTLTELNYYEVAIDVPSGETRFYVNASEIKDDPPTATLAATPTQAGRALGYGIIGGNASAFRATRLTQVERNDTP